MSIPVVGFFNNKGGVGKTSLVYHLAWMYADLRVPVLAADLDPQANLTASFFDEDFLEVLWGNDEGVGTAYGCVQPLARGLGDISRPEPLSPADYISVLAGDLRLSSFEGELSSQWPEALDGRERAFRVLSAFWRLLQEAAKASRSTLILVDLGPNLGAINRAALIATDYVVTPLSPDLFSLQGLRNLGPTFTRWRREWRDRLERKPRIELELPEGRMEPMGYVVLRHSVRLDRPVKAYDKWISRIPSDYCTHVLDRSADTSTTIRTDQRCLALLKHYRSLMPMAQEARKPVFHLKPADGAIGAHLQSAQDARKDFKGLALKILEKARIALPVNS